MSQTYSMCWLTNQTGLYFARLKNATQRCAGREECCDVKKKKKNNNWLNPKELMTGFPQNGWFRTVFWWSSMGYIYIYVTTKFLCVEATMLLWWNRDSTAGNQRDRHGACSFVTWQSITNDCLGPRANDLVLKMYDTIWYLPLKDGHRLFKPAI